MISLLQKDSAFLQDLMDKARGGYTELDFFFLRMILLNTHSPTAPYHRKNRYVPIDRNISFTDLVIEDTGLDQEDPEEDQLQMWRKACEILEFLDVPDLDRNIFSWKFFGDNSIRSWPVPESYPTVCKIFNQVKDLMREKRDLTIH